MHISTRSLQKNQLKLLSLERHHGVYRKPRIPVEAQSALSKVLGSLRRALRLRGPLAQHPTARTLHGLLLAVALWEGLSTAATFPISPNKAFAIIVNTPSEVGLVTALILLRAGLLRATIFVYLAIT